MKRETYNVKFVTKNIAQSQRGIIALATVIMLGAVFMEIGVAGAFVAYTLTNTNYGSRLSAEAYTAAQAGIDDGLLRFARNSDALPVPNPYTINVSTLGTRTVSVLLCRGNQANAIGDVCSGAFVDATYGESVATGRAILKQRQLRAVLSIHPVTGVVGVVSLRE